jgi:hypothetical protein
MHGVPLRHIFDVTGGDPIAELWRLQSWTICRRDPDPQNLTPLTPQPWAIKGILLFAPAQGQAQQGALVLDYKPAAIHPEYPTENRPFSGLYAVSGTERSHLDTMFVVRVENAVAHILPTTEHRSAGILALQSSLDGRILSGTFHTTNPLRPGRDAIVSAVTFSRDRAPGL